MRSGQRFESARRLPLIGLPKRNTRNKRGFQFVIRILLTPLTNSSGEPSAGLAEDLEQRLASEAQVVVDSLAAAVGLREPRDLEPREVGGDGGGTEAQFLG
jgi:hypothetical protein